MTRREDPAAAASAPDPASGPVLVSGPASASGPASGPWLVVIDGQRIFADPASDWGSPMWPDAAARIAELLPRFAGRTILTRWVPPAPGERIGSWDAYMAAWPFADRPASDPMFDLVPELAGLRAEDPAPSGAETVDAPAALPDADAPAPSRIEAVDGPGLLVGADAPATSRTELDDAPALLVDTDAPAASRSELGDAPAPARGDVRASPAPAMVVDAPTFGKWEALAPLVGPAPELVITGVSTDCCVISTVLPAADAGATLTVVTDACAGSTPENHAAACTVMGLYPPQVTLTTTAELLGSL